MIDVTVFLFLAVSTGIKSCSVGGLNDIQWGGGDGGEWTLSVMGVLMFLGISFLEVKMY